MLPEKDLIRLRHMLDAATEAITFAEGRTAEDLQHNRMFALAVVRAIEIVGEAANRISDGTRQEYPDIPWVSIVSMRNRIVHADFEIDRDVVWETIVSDLPDLVDRLRAIIDSD